MPYSRQVVAGTGELSDPSNGYTQHVKQWCGYTTRPAFGWIERSGIVVAFTRTPTGKERRPGRDASRLRGGTHFAHALVWGADDVPREILASIWKADVWQLAPPDDPPADLPVIESVDELGPRRMAGIERSSAQSSIAAFLYNTAHGLRSAISLPDETAVAHAAAIADVMPEAFALPSFSTWEEPERREDYDILVSLEPLRHFEPIAPDVTHGEPWLTAAGLLLAARDGENDAQDVVDALSDGAADLGGFAVGIARWGQLEDPTAGAMRSSAAGMAILASDARLLGRTLARHGPCDVARGMADGHSVDAILKRAAEAKSTAVITTAFEQEVTGRSPAEVMAAIDDVLQALGARAVDVVAGLADTWLDAGTLERLPSDQIQVLIRLLARSSPRRAVRALLTSEVATALIFSDETLPRQWRGQAAVAHPERLDSRELVKALHDDPRIAEAFAEHANDHALAILARALDDSVDSYAMVVVKNVVRRLAGPSASSLALPVVRRISHPHDRWAAAQRFAPPASALNAEWGHELLDAYAQIVIEIRADSHKALPALDPQRLPRLEDARFQAWRTVLENVGAARYIAIDLDRIQSAARAAAHLTGQYERDAAFDLIVDRAAEADPGLLEWLDGVRVTGLECGESPTAFSERLARAALREAGRSRRRVALWTMLWVADQLDEKRLSTDDVYDSRLNYLWRRLHRHDAVELGNQAKLRGLMSNSRAWLGENRTRLAKLK